VDVFGADYPTPDGTCIRDYIHVSDLAEGHVAALEYLQAQPRSIAVNLGTGRGTSVTQILDAVERVTGSKVAKRVVPRRAGDPPALVADPKRAESLLHWKAGRSLEHIVSTAWKWMQRQNPGTPGTAENGRFGHVA